MAPLLAAPDSVSASVLSRDIPAGRLAAERLLALRDSAARADDGASVDDLARLVAGAIGAARDAEIDTPRPAREALLASIKRHIETELNAPSCPPPRFAAASASRARSFIGCSNRTAGSSAMFKSGGFVAPSVCLRRRPAARRA